MSGQHILVATEADGQHGDGLDYRIECPDGPDEYCREWTECGQGEHDDDDLWDNDGEAHGVEHERLLGGWCVPVEPATCWVVNYSELYDAAEGIVPSPGRYPVRHHVEDEEFLSLTLVDSPDTLSAATSDATDHTGPTGPRAATESTQAATDGARGVVAQGSAPGKGQR